MEHGRSENTKRIAKNTLRLYGRMLFTMFVSLYTSREIMNALGVVDYGIMGVVGGLVSMLSLITSSLSSAVSRFLTYELGRGDFDRLKNAFSTSLFIHVSLALLILIIAETLGLWFVNNKMTIPPERLYAANWVFQASIVSFMFGLLSVPYDALIISHERMSVFAYIGILDTMLKLSIVVFIAYINWNFDKLIFYSVSLTIISLLLQCVYLMYCKTHFKECRFDVRFEKGLLKEISVFSVWNFIGCSASILKDQGVNVLYNLFVGPVLNAARGVAASVNCAVVGFAGNFMTALKPQITKSYAAGDLEYSHYLVERGSRFSFYILLFFVIPILLETKYILTIWLRQYPEHTVNFVRLVLILSLVEVLSNTLMTLQNATGKIRNYQLVVGGLLLSNFPLSYLCLRQGFAPEFTYMVALIVAILCLIARLLFVRKSASLSMSAFLKNVVLNVVMVAICAFIPPYICRSMIVEGILRFMIVGGIGVISSVVSILFIGCNKSERYFICSKLFKLIK